MELRVKVSELYAKVKEIYDDNMEYVDILLVSADNSDPDDSLPACISFTAISRNEPECGISYEEVEGVEVED